MTIRAIDFFCGGGGMSLGFTQAGVDVIAGLDIDPLCKDTYEANHSKSKFIQVDIAKYSPAQLINETGIKKYDDQLIFIGCSPCQYWSLIKSDKTKSKKTAFLLEHFQKFIDHFRPGYLVIENVPGIAKKADSPLLDFKLAIQKWGYQISEQVVNANDYGVPQNRHRYVLIASRVAVIQIPAPSNAKSICVRDVIGKHNHFPALEAGSKCKSISWHVAAALSEQNLKRISMTPINGGTRAAWKRNKKLQLPAYKGKDNQFSDVYGRLFWDKPAPTITTRFTSLSNGRFGHPEENRALSIREGACLQSFPKQFKIVTTSILHAARLIGNAVPPKLAYAIGKSIVRGSLNE